MANKTEATLQKEEAREKGLETPDAPLPLLDLSGGAAKQFIKQAKKRGYVTYEQLNAVTPSEEVTSEQIEDILAMLNEMGINVVETEEAEADDEEAREKTESEETESGELVEVTPRTSAKSEPKEPVQPTDDPVRKYLREMGSIGLLSRQGEVMMAMQSAGARKKALEDALKNTFPASDPVSVELPAPPAADRDRYAVNRRISCVCALPTQQNRGQVDAGRVTGLRASGCGGRN